MANNREVSQFGSYIIVNSDRIVGINTNLEVSGIVTANTYDGYDADLTNINVSGISSFGNIRVYPAGIITSVTGFVTYYGDGSKLSNLIIGLGVSSSGSNVGFGATILDFRGIGISTVSVGSGIATINIPGSAIVSISSVPPSSPLNGNLWYSSVYGRTFIYYDESALGIGTAAVWIDSAPFNQGGLYVSKYGDNVYSGLGVTIGSVSSPSIYFNGYTNSGFYSPQPNEFAISVSGSEKLNVNAGGATVSGIVTANNLRVVGVSTLSTVVVGGASTALVVNGDARITGILTIGTSSVTINGTTNRITIGTGNTIDGSTTNQIRIGAGLTVNNFGAIAGVVTATKFVGDGSGLTGAGSTVADDTATNATFYPLFTTITSGTVTSSKVSTTKLTFNPSTGTLTATALSGTLAGSNVSGNITGNAANITAFTINQSVGTSNNVQFNSIGAGTAGSGTAGEIRATNNITAYYSDDRLKTKLGNIENAIDKICSLNGFYYQANETAQSLGYQVKREVGVSAQEVEKILPEIVVPAPIDDKYKTIHYEKLIPLLVEAIKEQQIHINKLNQKIDNLMDQCH